MHSMTRMPVQHMGSSFGNTSPARIFARLLARTWRSNDTLRCPQSHAGIGNLVIAQPLRMKPDRPERLVIALVGMDFEARIAAGPGVLVICRNAENGVASSLALAIKRGYRSLISFGVAGGGLAPHLRPGDWIVASSIIDAQRKCPTDQVWSKKLLEIIPGAGYAPIAGVDAAIPPPGPNGGCTRRLARQWSTWNRITSHVSRRPTD